MTRYLFTALRISILTIFLVGVIYPLVVTGIAQVLFPRQAHGSLLRDGQTIRGSSLIGQSFTGPGYFHSRPSAAGSGYDTLASGGSNLGPTNKQLSNRVAADVQRIRQENPGLTTVPVDMVTTSGSGLDPDITPAAAYAQVTRIAQERGMREQAVRALVEMQLTGRQFGLLGEPRVNVLQLNRKLDLAARGIYGIRQGLPMAKVPTP